MQIIVPEIADNVQKAEILALLVSVGEQVRAAQPVLELEADEVSFEVSSPAAGRIEQIYVGIGDDVRVGDLVLTLRTAEDAAAAPIGPAAPAEPIEPAAPAELDDEPGARRGVGFHHGLLALRPRALPEHSGARLHDGLHHGILAIHDSIDITSLEAARQRYREEHETKLSLTAFVIKACAIALREHPRMNSSLIRQGRALAVKRFVHLSFAVYTEAGLISPVIKDADRRPLQELAAEIEALTAAARAQALTPEQLEGATFTVTNLRGFRGRAGITCSPGVELRGEGEARGGSVPGVLDRRATKPSSCSAVPGEQVISAGPLSAGPLSAGPLSAQPLSAQPLSAQPLSAQPLSARPLSGTKFSPVIDPPQVGALGLCHTRTESGRTRLPASLAYDQRVNDEDAALAFMATIAALLHDPLAMLLRA